MTEYNEERVKEVIAMFGTNAEMAEALGVHERTMRRWKARLAVKGYSPQHDMTRQVPDGFKVRGVSSLYNKDGVLSAQWIKSGADDERRYQMMLEAVEALKEDLPVLMPRAYAGEFLPDLMACYPIGDPHIGEYIWSEECGKSWDLAIA